MKSTDVFPSKYLKAEEIETDVTLTVANVVLETLTSREKGEEQKPVMYFTETEKGLILNKTNWGLCAKQYGDESDDWKGKPVTLTVIDVDAFGDVVSAIRIKPPRKVSATPIKTQPALVQKPHSNGETTTAFWAYAYQHEISKVDATAYLTEAQNDFARALELMKAQTGA